MTTDHQNTTSRGKIKEALELLNEAACEKKDELKNMFTDKYSHIKEVIAVDTQKAKTMAQDVITEGEEKLKQAVVKVDGRIRKDPWPYVAGTAAVALLLGYLIGKRK